MRFSRRNKNRPPQARRDAALTGEGIVGSVASEERSALLNGGVSEMDATPLGKEERASPAGDPTQRLMTALTRFHRHVAKGDSGAPQEYWSDDCMSELAVAAEISASQNWMHIVEALTGTARVLQSYENAGSARLCIAFLNECYENLCLMVSDLIVDKQRPEVIEKWRARYEQAAADLRAAGLTLVEDEPAESDQEALVAMNEDQDKAMRPPEPPADATPPEQGEILPFEMPHAEEGRGAAPIEAPSMDDFLPFPEASRADEDAEETVDSAVEPAMAETAGEEVPHEAEEAPDTLAEAAETVQQEAPPSPEPVAPGTPAADPEVGASLDALCEELAKVASAAADERRERFDAVAQKVVALEEHAERQGLEAAAGSCHTMLELCRAASQSDAVPDEGFFDSAYAFCEVYVTASQAPDSAMVASWRAETEGLCDTLMPEPAAEAPAEPDAEGGSAESLLETAQAAVARGDMSGAKALALQAVVRLAEVETRKAEKRVAEAETRFSQNAEDIEKSRANVKKAEQDVVVAEGRVAEGQAELADVRAHTSMVAEKVQGLEQHVAELDEQIRQMQAAREAECARINEASSELEQARGEETETEAELAMVEEAEQAARAHHEDARQNVKEFQRKRLELEEMLSRARETLTHHRSSLSDVERAISQLRPDKDAPAEDPEDLLF